jgi:hypothetical protein
MQTKTKLKAERAGKYTIRPVIALDKVFAPTGSSGAISGAVDSDARPAIYSRHGQGTFIVRSGNSSRSGKSKISLFLMEVTC